jgi:hypothetical protein
MKLGIPGTRQVAVTLAGAWSRTDEITPDSREPESRSPDVPVQALSGTVRARGTVTGDG